MQMPINDAGVALLEDKEQFVDHAFPDPYSPLGKALRTSGMWKTYLKAAFPLPDAMATLDGAPWTFGWGFTKGVSSGDTISRIAADQRLASEMATSCVVPITAACTVAPNENQLAAMVVMAWNIGTAAFLASTVLKCHNRSDFAAAARAFALFNKARGEVSAGLTLRRAQEAALYLTPVADDEPHAMPKDVEPETSLAKSPIIAGSTVSAGTATIALVADATKSVHDIRDNLGDLLPWALVAVVLGGAGWAVWNRIKQRRWGWA